MNKNLTNNWLKTWAIHLINIYLFAAALNCLFQWLANNTMHDLLGCITTTIFATAVYIISKKDKGIIVAIVVLALWFISFSTIMNYTNISKTKAINQIESEK